MITFIDCNNLCYRAFYATGNMAYGGNPTGVVFGFLNQLFSYILNYPEKFTPVFCWDSKESFRKEIYPEYKQNRRKDQTEEQKELFNQLFYQMDLLRRDILPDLGWKKNVMHRPGYEADDLIAFGVSKIGRGVNIISSDEDLFQLLNKTKDVLIYNPGKNSFFTESNFVTKYGIYPTSWPLVKAMAGCSSDNIKGVIGVGEKTSIKYINSKLDPKTKAFTNILTSQDIVQRNLKLVKLPFIVNSYAEDWASYPFTPTDTKVSKDKFKELFKQYGFRSFDEKFKQITPYLNLN